MKRKNVLESCVDSFTEDYDKNITDPDSICGCEQPCFEKRFEVTASMARLNDKVNDKLSGALAINIFA